MISVSLAYAVLQKVTAANVVQLIRTGKVNIAGQKKWRNAYIVYERAVDRREKAADKNRVKHG